MKITGVETVCVDLPPRRAHRMSFDREGRLGRYVIVRVLTDEGIQGLGEATVLPMWGGDHMRYFGELPGTTVHIIKEYLIPAITGQDPFDIEVIHAHMDRTVKGYPYAKAAIDIALYDIMGKALGVPVYRLLGGCNRAETPLAHSLGIMDTQTAVNEALAAVDEGIRTIKVKVGIDAEQDVTMVRELRKALSDEIEITVDANQGYPSPKVAIQAIRQMCEYGISMAEQPVEGLDAMAEVRAAVPCLVMADESAWTPQDILEIQKKGAADAFSLYTTKPGGLFKAKKVAAVAEATGILCNVNGSAETGVGTAANLHLVAATGIVTLSSGFPVTTLKGKEQTKVAGVFYLDDIIRQPFHYGNGSLRVPDGPGLGVEIDEERLAKYRTD
jgi:muconate cycloisomerase